MGQVVGNQNGEGYRTVEAVAPVNADGKIIGSSSAPVQVAATTSIPTTDSLGGTRAYNWGTNVRIASTSTSSAATPLPTLGTSREIMAHASERCFVRFGDSAVTAAAPGNGQLILEAGERFHLRLAAGVTHFRVIRDTADGFVSIAAVA